MCSKCSVDGVMDKVFPTIMLCFSDALAMSNKASTAQLFDNMTLDIEQLLSKVCHVW